MAENNNISNQSIEKTKSLNNDRECRNLISEQLLEAEKLKSDMIEVYDKNNLLFNEQKDTLRDLKLYKTIVKLIIFSIFGGVIVIGVYAQKYIDKRISIRIDKTESIIFANSSALSKNWLDALNSINKYSDYYLDEKSLIDSELRSNYLITVVWILASVPHDGFGFDFPGQTLWDRTKNSKDFEEEFYTKTNRHGDAIVQSNLGDCWLKYSASKSDLKKAADHYQMAIREYEEDQDKWGDESKYAAIEIMLGDLEQAKIIFKQALKIAPQDSFFYQSRQTFEETIYYKDLNLIAQRHGIKDYIDKFETIMRVIMGQQSNSADTKNSAAD